MTGTTLLGWNREQWAIACAWFKCAKSRVPMTFDDFTEVLYEWGAHHNYDPSPVEKTLIVPFGFRQEKDVGAFGRLMKTPEMRSALGLSRESA